MNQAPEEPSKKSSALIKLSSQDAASFFPKDLFEGYLGFWQNISSLEQEKISVDLELGVSALNEGGLVAFPTETVYGLGAMISQPAAVKKIYEYKNRPINHPLIVHVPIGFSIEKYAKVTSLAQKLIYLFWPGPLTLILEKTDAVPFEVTGGQNSVGLRCPDHPIAQAILRGVNQGVAAPSANRFGRISPTQYEHVYHEFSEIDPHLTIIDGDILPPQVGIESTIIDARGQEPIILRPGMLGLDEILNRLAELVEPLDPPKPPKYDALILPPTPQVINNMNHVNNNVMNDSQIYPSLELNPPPLKVSGALASHYAPNQRLYILTDAHLDLLLKHLEQSQSKPPLDLHHNTIYELPWVWVFRHSTYQKIKELQNIKNIEVGKKFLKILILKDDVYSYAHDLYKILRQADDFLKKKIYSSQKYPEWVDEFWQHPAIFWQAPSSHHLNEAIYDRLNKAAYHTRQLQEQHGKKIEDVLRLIDKSYFTPPRLDAKCKNLKWQ